MVVLLCGPPGAGKTTAARASGLQVFDRDDARWRSESAFRDAIHHLASDRSARAVVIRSGATSSARRSAANLIGATHTFMLLADVQVLRQRIRDRRRADFIRGVASLDRWFERFDRADGVQDFPGWGDLAGSMPIGSTSRSW